MRNNAERYFARGHVGMVTWGQGEITTFRVAGGRRDIFGSQVSAVGYQVRVIGFGYEVRVLNLYLVLNT